MNTQSSPLSRRTRIAILTCIGLTWLVSLMALAWMPEQIPTHWGLSGQPDAYSSKLVGVLQLPVIMSVLAVVLRVIPRLDPKKDNYASFAGAYDLIQIAILVFLAALQGIILLAGLGLPVDMSLIIPVIMGLLFTVLGNVMGKLRPNWFAGIRTPWTLSSPDVWTRTHRIGGLLMVMIGILLIVVSPIVAVPVRFVLLLGGVLGWSAFTIGYSYWLWRSLA